MTSKVDDYIPSFDDYVSWVEELVLKYVVEIDIISWWAIKQRLKTDRDYIDKVERDGYYRSTVE